MNDILFPSIYILAGCGWGSGRILERMFPIHQNHHAVNDIKDYEPGIPIVFPYFPPLAKIVDCLRNGNTIVVRGQHSVDQWLESESKHSEPDIVQYGPIVKSRIVDLRPASPST